MSVLTEGRTGHKEKHRGEDDVKTGAETRVNVYHQRDVSSRKGNNCQEANTARLKA